MCACYNAGKIKMKHSITIGFDAKHAMSDDAEFGAYSRLVIESLALAAPRYSYFRPYVPMRTPHKGYEAIERLHNIETMEPDGALWRKLTLPWRVWRVAHDLHNGGVELYHGLTEHLPLGLAARKIRSVVTVHNMAYLYDKNILNSPENLIHRLYMGRILHRVDRIVAVSESVKRDIVKHCNIYSDKIDVVYSGVAKRFTEPVSDEQIAAVTEKYMLPERYLLSVGRHIERRNMLNIIKIMPMMDHELHYVIVGKTTAHTTRLQRVAKSLGVLDRIHFITNATEEEMPAIYKRASILINISKYEGFPTSVAEAMSVGTPCIASRKLCMEEIAENSALYVSATNRDEIISTIRRLLEDKELRDDLIATGKRHASRFRPEVVAFNLINCYHRIGVNIRG
jgi:glycosyltransferase involved in cell wall biosynthesis